MKHARPDYNRFQDPALNDPSLLGEGSTPIGEDEPVFLMRAKDAFFIDMLEAYKNLAVKHAIEGELVAAVESHIALAEDWCTRNLCKLPDMPKVTHEGEAGDFAIQMEVPGSPLRPYICTEPTGGSPVGEVARFATREAAQGRIEVLKAFLAPEVHYNPFSIVPHPQPKDGR